jgi:glyoxylase-like metal-dependent hydrolase (beta-lactamase superfamily II)
LPASAVGAERETVNLELATAIHAYNPGPMTGRGNTTWLLPGRVPVLVDAGTGHPRHRADLEAALAGAPLGRVIVTHAHGDHASGARALRDAMPSAGFAKMPWPERDPRYDIQWEPLADGDVVEAGDSTLVAVHTPGHSPDHLSFWHESSRTLFCGDLAVKGSTVVIPASAGGDLAAYLASLERVLALEPARMLPAHGAVIDDPAALLRSYLAHRREREEQVLAALAAGDATVEDIVARIYAAVAGPLVPMARESATAHLVKLERERRVRRDGNAWALT